MDSMNFAISSINPDGPGTLHPYYCVFNDYYSNINNFNETAYCQHEFSKFNTIFSIKKYYLKILFAIK